MVCADIDADKANAVVESIVNQGGNALAVACDVSCEADNAALAEACRAHLGEIDVLYANAGISVVGSVLETSLAEWNRLIAINLTGTFLSCKAMLPAMIAAGKGSIILQSSISGHLGFEKLAAYSAAKGGLHALARQMAVDFAANGIRVNAIAPGTIKTDLVEQTYRNRIVSNGHHPSELDAALAASAQRYPLRCFGSPEDVAHMAVFLASDESKWITGSVFNVDGGYGAV